METVTETGWLVTGGYAIGGDATGWALQTAKRDIEVDVSRVEAKARKFKDKFVTITGYYKTEEWIERKPSSVLVAETITPSNRSSRTIVATSL